MSTLLQSTLNVIQYFLYIGQKFLCMTIFKIQFVMFCFSTPIVHFIASEYCRAKVLMADKLLWMSQPLLIFFLGETIASNSLWKYLNQQIFVHRNGRPHKVFLWNCSKNKQPQDVISNCAGPLAENQVEETEGSRLSNAQKQTGTDQWPRRNCGRDGDEEGLDISHLFMQFSH